MTQQQRIDRIFEEVLVQSGSDVSALLGDTLTLTVQSSDIITKETCFLDLVGKHVFSHVDIDGDIEGKGGLVISMKDAILLGGTLIMLPETELTELLGAENYTEDIDDSYGEIANIIIGACSKVFEESYPKSCRFIRKEVVSFKPAKVNPEDDEIIANTSYYRVLCSMNLGEKELGQLSFVLPAETFGIEGVLAAVQDETEPAVSEDTLGETPDASESETETEAAIESQPVPDTAPEESVAVVSPEDIDKNTDRIGQVCSESFAKMGEELGLLLGSEVQVSNLEGGLFKKSEFISGLKGKQVLAELEIHGEISGSAYISIALVDAIHMGGVLIMLPPAELDIVVEEGNFDDDTQDAFGEIASIVSGIYTAQFEDKHPSRSRFVRSEMIEYAPEQVDIASATPMPDKYYYVSSMDVSVGDKTLGRMSFLLGAEDFSVLPRELAQSAGAANEIDTVAQAGPDASAGSSVGEMATGAPVDFADGNRDSGGQSNKVSCEILLVASDSVEADKISAIAKSKGYSVACIGFNDNIGNYFTPELKAVYLIMTEVNEQAFGMVIKLSTGPSVPIVAAGPGWTRSSVIKAVKYGVKDILLTPADNTDIETCLSSNIIH